MAPSQSKLNFKKDSPIRKSSPGKNSSKLAKRPAHVLTVIGFPPLPVEIYVYRRGTDRDGYTGTYRKVIDGEMDSADLIRMGFTQYYVHRLSLEVNAPKVGEDSWNCIVMVRYVPGMQPSTSQTRAEGNAFLRSWLMDPEHSKYPPNDILTVDNTRSTNLEPMDHFLLDEHIFIILRAVVDPDRRFFTDHPELAHLFYSGPNYYPEAVTQYGYGTVAPPADGQVAVGNLAPNVEGNHFDGQEEGQADPDQGQADPDQGEEGIEEFEEAGAVDEANGDNETEENEGNQGETKQDRTSSRKPSKKRR